MHYRPCDLTREQLDQTNELILLEFGIDACPHCQRGIQAMRGVSEFSTLKHIAIEDGPGRRLGRTFRVKLWPTYILLKEGCELARIVRPQSSADFASLTQLLDQA